jgi:hypothetical protein
MSGKHLHIADYAAEFAEAVIETLAEPAKAEQMGLEGQALVESICGSKVTCAKLIETFTLIAPLSSRSLISWPRWVIARVKSLILPLRIHFASKTRLMKRQINAP